MDIPLADIASGSLSFDMLEATLFQLGVWHDQDISVYDNEFLALSAAGDDPAVTFTADDSYVTTGESTTLRWNAENAVSAIIDQGVGIVGVSGSIQVSPAASTTYRISVTGAGGTVTADVTVDVGTESLPEIISFTSDHVEVTQGNNTTLRWETEGATSVTITDDDDTEEDIGATTLDGVRGRSPGSTVNYLLTATNAAGSIERTVHVMVVFSGNAHISSFTAVPSTIAFGEESLLSWETSNAVSARLLPDIGEVSADGSETVMPNYTTLYELTAYPGAFAFDDEKNCESYCHWWAWSATYLCWYI